MMALRLNKDPLTRAKEAVFAILEHGDFSIAADMVRNGESFNDDLREVVAAKLDGSLKRKRGAKEGEAVKRRKVHALFCNEWLIENGWGGGQADAKASLLSDVFGVSTRTIYEWLGDQSAKDELRFDPHMQLFQMFIACNLHKKWTPDDFDFMRPFALRLHERDNKPVPAVSAKRVGSLFVLVRQ